MEQNNIVIVAAKRTPTGRFNGQFVNVPAPLLGATAISAAVNHVSLPLDDVNAVYMGCVLPAGLGQAPARQAALGAKLSVQTPCTTINKMCGSGMQTVMMACDALLTGIHRIMVAGGMENMSRAPYLLPGARQGYRMGHQQVIDHMLFDGLEDAYEKGCHMGHFAEKCAREYGITREEQDRFALASIERARYAMESGWFHSEIAPVTVIGKKPIEKDEGPFSVDTQKIPNLSPVFQKDGTITAANASSIADGAAALVLMREDAAEKYSYQTLARIVAYHSYANEPSQFPTAPIGAIKGLMSKIGWEISSVDLFEINEAFAVVTLVAMQQLKIPHDRVNVNGGGCILGHPIGASGARIMVTLLHALRQRGLKRGVAALCIGGGEATAIAIEI